MASFTEDDICLSTLIQEATDDVLNALDHRTCLFDKLRTKMDLADISVKEKRERLDNLKSLFR